jgi:hydrogenase expression/formation protein HypE
MADKRILLAHGSGGRLTHELIESVFLKHLGNPVLERMDDAAVWALGEHGPGRLALTTDAYVISPLFFPGGDIGKLAVCGTVNDLAMVGATPVALTAAFILEEGLPLGQLEHIVASMAATAAQAAVTIAAGDTKVVGKGGADLVFITTAGIGTIPEGVDISASNARPGDLVILSGPVGLHGLAVMSQREGLPFSFPLESDCAPLNGLVAAMLAADPRIHCLRDPTRGGLATTLNEIAGQSGVGIEIEEPLVPIPESVQAACDLLGIDPLYVANEGKLVAVVPPQACEALLQAMQRHPYGRAACVIGRLTSEHAGRVVLKTRFGGRRILDMLSGAQLPRIC